MEVGQGMDIGQCQMYGGELMNHNLVFLNALFVDNCSYNVHSGLHE